MACACSGCLRGPQSCLVEREHGRRRQQSTASTLSPPPQDHSCLAARADGLIMAAAAASAASLLHDHGGGTGVEPGAHSTDATGEGRSGAVGAWIMLGSLGLSVVLLQLLPLDAFFDGEISSWWCVGLTWKCTVSEAAGLWSVILFYLTMVGTTVIHSIAQSEDGTSGRNEAVMRHTTTDVGGDGRTVCVFVVYFFCLVAGTTLWAFGGVHWVHPIQIYQVQIIGVEVLVACTALFLAVHVDMGENWSPEPEAKERHELVTHGVFSWARHPMYVVFLYAAIGTLLATLNWLFAWCVSGLVAVTFGRIETEERILVALFGARYLEYRKRVPALGPGPWRCFGFDEDWPH
eukprot:COSAG02_NODE_259_length_26776_cov_1723.750084_13_plen_348_part_00